MILLNIHIAAKILKDARVPKAWATNPIAELPEWREPRKN